MRIAIFVTAAFCKADYVEAVSGHVQLPVKSGEVMVAQGHDVTLITTRQCPDDILPYGLFEKFSIKEVQHSTKQWPKQGILLSKGIKQVIQLLTFLKTNQFDVVYFSGGDKIGLLLGLLSILGVRGRTIFAPIHRPCASMSLHKQYLYRLLCQRIDAVVATSEYVREGWATYCSEGSTRTLYPGVIKDMGADVVSGDRRSVLFWRNANYENGADIAEAAVMHLAGKLKDYDFTFAVRPGDELEEDLLELERKFPNVYVHLYPYSGGVTLKKLLNKALFVIAPFRYLSMNPQMAILESLYAGVPVVATDVESNREVVINGETGIILASKEIPALENVIKALLKDRPYLDRLRKNTRSLTVKKWNWRDYQEGLMDIVEG